jgi:hypothetical protein
MTKLQDKGRTLCLLSDTAGMHASAHYSRRSARTSCLSFVRDVVILSHSALEVMGMESKQKALLLSVGDEKAAAKVMQGTSY